MFVITIKQYSREYEGDERYEIVQMRCDDYQIEPWIRNPKGLNYEVLSISRVFI